MRKIIDNITSYAIKWWEGADKQMLFWQVLAAILVTWSIYSNT